MTISTERFPNRFAGSAFMPFVVQVRKDDGSVEDLTGQSATLTIRKSKGVAAVAVAIPNDNVPDTKGLFSFPATPSQVESPGEYTLTVNMNLDGLPEVGRFALTIDPAT